MKYISYIDKNYPDVTVQMEYDWSLDIKLLAAIHFIVQNGSADSALSLIIDAILWSLDYDKIYQTFDSRCTIVKNDLHEVLNKKVVTVSDLFS